MTITAKVIADSISATSGVRITTFELEYPRFIHAEFMTHRVFSRNAASSRAIPVEKAIQLILDNPAMPSHWGKNQPGMSAREECNALIPARELPATLRETRATGALSHTEAWLAARDCAVDAARAFAAAGYHKQIVNRILEPFSHIKVICTATEFDNFFNLRCHPDAQPEIQILANAMWVARQCSTPVKLQPGYWHVPYFGNGYWSPFHADEDTSDLDRAYLLEDALAISSSCCAQVSYRKLDDSLEKARSIYERLVESKPVHASPFEHQATPMEAFSSVSSKLPMGWTHESQHNGEIVQWSGNFREWCQHRQMIRDNVCREYVRAEQPDKQQAA